MPFLAWVGILARLSCRERVPLACGYPFLVVVVVAAGRLGAWAWRRVSAVVILRDQGPTGGEAKPQAPTAADQSPSSGEDPQP